MTFFLYSILCNGTLKDCRSLMDQIQLSCKEVYGEQINDHCKYIYIYIVN